jgi:hypothetical protein
MNTDELEELLAERAHNQHEVDLSNALYNLMNNHQFKLIMQDYTEKLPVKLIKQKGTIAKAGGSTDNLDKQIEGIGLFMAYLEDIKTAGSNAKTALVELNNQLDKEES